MKVNQSLISPLVSVFLFTSAGFVPVAQAQSFLPGELDEVAEEVIEDEISETTESFFGEQLSSQLGGLISRFLGDILGLDRWVAQLDQALNDPCQSLPVVFISAPEPGWCIGGGGGAGGGENSMSIGEILSRSRGPLGIPTPERARQTVEETLRNAGESPDTFEINPVVHALFVGNAADRANTKLAIDSVLGDAGQEQIAQEMQTIQGAVTQTFAESEGAQVLDVTQDVQKAAIRLQAQQSLIAGATQAELMKLRTDTQFSNLNLTNLSRSVDGLTRTARSEQAANSAKALYISAQANLF